MNERELKFPSALIGDIETWRCVHCGDNNDADGPPQCGCGTMKPGYECCAWCESYGPVTTFTRIGEIGYDDPMCPTCVAQRRKKCADTWIGFGVLILIVLVLWAIWVVVG